MEYALFLFGGDFMYKDIEEIYKKKSPYNRIKIRMFWVYLLAIPFLLSFNYYKSYFMMIVAIGIVMLIMKKISEKVLNEKLYFSFNNKGKVPLNKIIESKEKILFIDYLKIKSLYNKATIKCLLEHYRCYIKPKIIGGNFLSILSIIISVLLAFISKDGFDFNSFSTSLPYLLSIIFLFGIVYYPISKITKIKKFFTGEDGIIERLESIFSELYVEFDENNCIEKSKKEFKKIKISKRKKSKKK